MIEANDVYTEIKKVVSLVDEMEKHGLSLMRAGQSRLKCVCPFHTDSDPSLTVYLEGDDGFESWCCFGCRVGGDVINFVMKAQNISKSQAIKYFAENYPLRLAGNIDFKTSMDLTVGVKENYQILKNRSITLSHNIRLLLRESEHPEKILLMLKPYLKEIDGAVNDNDYFTYLWTKDDIVRIMKDVMENKKKNAEIEK